MEDLISTNEFYQNYFGHDVNLLRQFYSTMNSLNQNRNRIWLAGDSSLDNKAYVDGSLNLPWMSNIFDDTNLSGDVSTYVNYYLHDKNFYCLNCAVEESTLQSKQVLNSHDLFIRDNMTVNDILVVSIGGNDIALKPTWTTIYNLLLCLKTNTMETLTNHPEKAWGLKYFVDFFKQGLESYISKLTSKTQPKCVIVCMIYFPYIGSDSSWADKSLGYLEYNSNPTKLQVLIQSIFKLAISKIQIPELTLMPCPLYQYMDGTNKTDYVSRVEPSVGGSRKIASAIYNIVNKL